MASVEHRVDAVLDPAAESARVTVEHLYRDHWQRVDAVCSSILRDRAEAEDAAQQVFVSAFCALLRGSEPRDPAAWLVTIARNESWARARRPRSLSLAPDLQDLSREDPLASAQRHGELARIWQAIEALPDAQRRALLLRELRGLTYDELAADLQLSGASVRSLLNRARRTLRSQLQKGAALLGAQWLNLLARGASTPTVSSASRSAAVGLSALALTGGAVVAPSLVAPPHHRPTLHVVTPRAAPASALTPPPAPVSRPRPRPGPNTALSRPVVDDSANSGADQRGRDRTSDSTTSESSAPSGDGGTGSNDSSSLGGGESGSPVASATQPTSTSSSGEGPSGTSDGSGSDGGHDGVSGSSGSGDGSSGSDGADGGS